LSLDALRILLILENAGAGSGRHVVDLSRELLHRGNEVTLVYSQTRVEQWFTDAIAETAGLRTFCIDMVRGPSLRDFASLAQIRNVVARDKSEFDIIHGHSSKGGALARFSGLFSDAARVYTPHAFVTLDPELSAIKHQFYGKIERALAALSHGIVCVSEAERRHAMTLNIPAHKLTVIQNCLTPLPAADRVAAREQLRLNDDEICIGFVGRLAPQKSIGRLPTAFADVSRSDPAARLAIVGAGPEEEQLRIFADQFNISDKVIWTGQADGPALMAGFDIFALSSNYEAFPYVLLEAAARGLPIVSTRVGGAEEIVHDGINGYVVDDVAQLGNCLLRISRDPRKRQEMGSDSLARAAAFNVEKMVAETLVYYHSLVNDIR